MWNLKRQRKVLESHSHLKQITYLYFLSSKIYMLFSLTWILPDFIAEYWVPSSSYSLIKYFNTFCLVSEWLLWTKFPSYLGILIYENVHVLPAYFHTGTSDCVLLRGSCVLFNACVVKLLSWYFIFPLNPDIFATQFKTGGQQKQFQFIPW